MKNLDIIVKVTIPSIDPFEGKNPVPRLHLGTLCIFIHLLSKLLGENSEQLNPFCKIPLKMTRLVNVLRVHCLKAKGPYSLGDS